MTQTRALFAAVAAAAVLTGGWIWTARERRAQPIARLAAAASHEARSIEARLSGFPWAPLARAKRGASALSPLSSLTAAMTAAADQSSPEGRHASAIARFLTESPEIVIGELTAVAQGSRNAAAWNDLAAAHYEAAVLSGSLERLGHALGAVDQALLFDPASAEALFNRALILERFHLRDLAIYAWREFVTGNPGDDWSGEAREHLAALTAPRPTLATEIERRYASLQASDRAAADALIALEPGEARHFGETEGLARWGQAWLRRDRAADRDLAAVRTLAEQLTAYNGETALHDAVGSVDRATATQSDALARGYIGYRDGHAAYAYSARKMTEAETRLSKAARELELGGSPLAGKARLFAAAARFWQGRHDEAETEFQALLASTPVNDAFRAHIHWQLASCFIARADTGNSLLHLTRAIEIFTRLNERGNAAYLHNIISQVYDGVRDYEKANRHRVLALRELGKVTNGRLVHAIHGMVYAALQRREWAVARSLLTAQLAMNARKPDAELQIAALLRRARVHSHLGDTAAAHSDVDLAAAVAASISDPGHRTKLQADCDTSRALIVAEPAAAIPLLTAVLEYHAKSGWQRLRPDLYLRRGRMYRTIGDRARAVADFEAGIALLESHRETINKGEGRWGMLDAAQELFEEAISEALRDGAGPAFAYAERQRARSLTDVLQETLPAFDAALLPADTLLVEFAALPDKLLVFAVEQSGITVDEVPIARTALRALADRFTEALRADRQAEAGELAARLKETLLARTAASIAKHEQVVFVTDATTSGIAFAILQDRAGRMLVEDVTISVAPSARLYLASRMRRPRPRSNILIVENPANGQLQRLRRASAEADAIEGEYPHVRRLGDRAATREAFVDESRKAGVIHFVGHGITSSDSAALLLASTDDDSGRFDATAISRLDLRNTDIVILAACDTARGPVRSAEGILSVAHAFLQAGAPGVIATLWPLSDREAAEFFPLLHRHLARGTPAAEALRLTQREWIRRSGRNEASLWAAVQVIGF